MGVGVSFVPTLFSRMFPYLIKALLLIAVYRMHKSEFGGGSFGEPVSVRRARERRETGGAE
jgi:hypothetical protein